MPIKQIIAVRKPNTKNDFANHLARVATANDGVVAKVSNFEGLDRSIRDGNLDVNIVKVAENGFDIVVVKKHLLMMDAIETIKGGCLVVDWRKSRAKKRMFLSNGELNVIL